MKISAIFLCAGSGDRFFSDIPKQFHQINDKKLYIYALDTLISSHDFEEILIVTNHPHLLDSHDECKITPGGKTRQESVFMGLKDLNQPDAVIIIEAVRPFITQKMIHDHIAMLQQGVCAINTCIPATDTINICQHKQIKAIPPRKNFLQGQTPQSFNYNLLLKAHQDANDSFTDDCGLMLSAGHNVTYIEGSSSNIKITFESDLKIAKTLIASGYEIV